MTLIALALWLVFGLVAAVHLLRAWELSVAELLSFGVGFGLLGIATSSLLRAMGPKAALGALLLLALAIPLVQYDFYRQLRAWLAVRQQGTHEPEKKLAARLMPRLTAGRLVVAAILLLAAFFRLSQLGYSEFQGDEARAMLLARALVERRDAALLLWHKKGPIELLLPAAVLQLNDASETSARLCFAVAGWSAVALVISLGRRLWSARAGWLAGLVLAIDGYMIAFSRIVQYQSIVVLFALLALASAWRFYRADPPAHRHLFVAAVFLGFGTWAHYEMLLLALPVAWLALARARKERWPLASAARRLGLPAMLAGGLTAAFYLPFIRHPQFQQTGAYILERRVGGQLLYNQLRDLFERASFYNASFYVLLLSATVLGLIAWQWTACLRNRHGAGLALLFGGTWVALVGLAVLRPDWFIVGGRSAVIAVFLVPFAMLLADRRRPAEWQAALLLFAVPFSVYAFLTAKPHTHFYTMMPGVALLCGWAWDRALAWLEARPSLGVLHARLGVGVVGFALLSLFGIHQYVVFIRHTPEYKRVYPEARLPIWSPFGDRAPRGGYFGFPYRAGWNALRQFGDPLRGDYDSNEEPLITGWYTWGAVRCSGSPDRYYLAWRPQDAEKVPLEAIEAQYRQVAMVCVNGMSKLTVWQRPDSAWRAADGPPELWLDNWDLGQAPQNCGPLPARQCPPPEAGWKIPEAASLVCPERPAPSEVRANRASDLAIWRQRPLAVSQALRLPLPQVEYSVRLQDGLRLMGADFPGARRVDARELPAQLELAGDDPLGVVLLWRAWAQPSRNYSVFVHLVAADGRRLSQHDGWPDCGRSPTSHWQVDQLVFDGHALPLESTGDLALAPGEYRLLAGVYESPSGRRLAALEDEAHLVGQDNAMVLARVRVTEP